MIRSTHTSVQQAAIVAKADLSVDRIDAISTS
jgi:hypothetical protein